MKQRDFLYLLPTLALLFGCAASDRNLVPSASTHDLRDQRFVGWFGWAGEFLLYDDPESLRLQKKAPHCTSGVFLHQYTRKLRQYEGKKVEIIGSLHRFSELPWEGPPGTVLNRRVLGDSVIPNFCYGSEVLLAKSIRPLS